MPKNMKRSQFRFQQIVDLCYNNELFTWAMEGKVLREMPADGGEETETFECNSKSASMLGRILSDEMCGRDFRLPGRCAGIGFHRQKVNQAFESGVGAQWHKRGSV